MSREPIGERVKALETKLPALEEKLLSGLSAIEKELSAGLQTITKFGEALQKVQSRLATLNKFAPTAIWLAGAGLMHAAGGNVAKAFAAAWKVVSVAL